MDEIGEAALKSFEERMAAKPDDPPPSAEEPKRLECSYQLPVVYKCPSAACAGKIVALAAPDIVQAGLSGLQINLNCPGCKEPVSLMPPEKPLVTPVRLSGNRAARREAMHAYRAK